MENAKVVSLKAARELKKAQQEDSAYQALIDRMEKVELLNEMVRFQEERSRVGELTIGMIVRGKILFRALEANAETESLRSLSSSYRRHLEFELKELLK